MFSADPISRLELEACGLRNRGAPALALVAPAVGAIRADVAQGAPRARSVLELLLALGPTRLPKHRRRALLAPGNARKSGPQRHGPSEPIPATSAAQSPGTSIALHEVGLPSREPTKGSNRVHESDPTTTPTKAFSKQRVRQRRSPRCSCGCALGWALGDYGML